MESERVGNSGDKRKGTGKRRKIIWRIKNTELEKEVLVYKILELTKEELDRMVFMQNIPKKGCLSKQWYNVGENKFLVKGNSVKDGIPHYEPYSEVIACKIGKALGLDCVEYFLDDASKYPLIQSTGVKHVSICPKIPLKGSEQMISFYDIMQTLHKRSPDDYVKAYRKLKIPYSSLYKMLVFDALIGNEDRHLNNWDYIVTSKDIRPAPLLDHGASLLAMVGEKDLNVGGILSPDKSKTFEASHSIMIREMMDAGIENLFDVDCNDVINVFYAELDKVKGFLSGERCSRLSEYFEARVEHYLIPFLGKEKDKKEEVLLYDKEEVYEDEREFDEYDDYDEYETDVWGYDCR